jgi:hypothetical protein
MFFSIYEMRSKSIGGAEGDRTPDLTTASHFYPSSNEYCRVVLSAIECGFVKLSRKPEFHSALLSILEFG